MDRSNNSASNSPIKKKLISKIRNHYPNLNEKEVSNILSNIKKFVVLVQRIQTEPQAQILYKEKKTDGQSVKNRIIQTDVEELVKAAGKPGHLKPAFEKLRGFFPERRYGRRSKKI